MINTQIINCKDTYQIGMSTWADIPDRELFEKYANAGGEVLEISATPPGYEGIDYSELRKLSDEYGIKLWSFHLPYYATDEIGHIDPSSLDTKVRKRTVEYFTNMINRGANIGIDKFVVHPSAEPIGEDERSERIKCSKETLNILAEIAAACGAVIAVEDLPRSCLGNCSDEIIDLISINSNLRVCFDTNHLLFEDNVEFIHKLGNKIVTLHVSDYDFVNERHWLPGEGKINWQSLLDALSEVCYDGAWMYEVGLKTPPTITRTRDLVFEDFVRNAKEIFANKSLTLIK